MNREQLISIYTQFSDEQIMEAYHNPGEYTDEAKEALADVIQKRGGIDKLLTKEQRQNTIAAETERIKREVRRLGTPSGDLELLNKMIISQILDENHIQSIIQQTYKEINLDAEDIKIKPRTIIGGIIGAGIAGLTGGIFWGLQMMWSGRVFAIFLFGLVLLCYGLVKVITKQSHKNIAVFIFTAISVLIALVIGQLMFEIFGRQ